VVAVASAALGQGLVAGDVVEHEVGLDTLAVRGVTLLGAVATVGAADDDRVVAALAAGEDTLGLEDGVHRGRGEGKPREVLDDDSRQGAADDKGPLAGTRQQPVETDSDLDGATTHDSRHDGLRVGEESDRDVRFERAAIWLTKVSILYHLSSK